MWSRVIREIKAQYEEVCATVKTGEFWVYFALLGALFGLTVGLAYVASGFDELTRQQALMAIACRAGDAQLLTIIVGGMAFVLLSVFTLGEVVRWFEEARHAKSVRQSNRASRWRPVLFVASAIGLGLIGFVVLFSWCR
ncbi:MAG TPA: hypothetical protein VFH22_10910 [Rhodocyclaceae bacterium]|nr:hypothetical protein [Rhodocyclaceae bacterium]